jgi:hypothetical protein
MAFHGTGFLLLAALAACAPPYTPRVTQYQNIVLDLPVAIGQDFPTVMARKTATKLRVLPRLRLLGAAAYFVPLDVLEEGIDVALGVRAVVHRVRVLVHIHDE